MEYFGAFFLSLLAVGLTMAVLGWIWENTAVRLWHWFFPPTYPPLEKDYYSFERQLAIAMNECEELYAQGVWQDEMEKNALTPEQRVKLRDWMVQAMPLAISRYVDFRAEAIYPKVSLAELKLRRERRIKEPSTRPKSLAALEWREIEESGD